MVWFWRSLFGLGVVATAYACLAPLEGAPPLPAQGDKIVHFSMFALDGVLALMAFRGARQRAVVLLCLALLGGVLEVLQGFVPFRTPDFGDVVANTVGVVVAGLLGRLSGGARL